MDRLEEIRQRTEAATDGPWERFDTPDYAEIHVLGGKEAGFLPVALADEAYNADFIAHSREDISYLLSEVARMNALHKREIIVTGEYAQRVIDLTDRAEAAEAERDALKEEKLISNADVAQVVPGRWLINSDGYYPYCSECKEEPKSGIMTHYCPNCGAAIDGKRKEAT